MELITSHNWIRQPCGGGLYKRLPLSYHYGTAFRFGVPLLTSVLNGMGLEAIQGYDGNSLLGNYFNKNLGEDLSVVERE